jgi:hypothetical protein
MKNVVGQDIEEETLGAIDVLNADAADLRQIVETLIEHLNLRLVVTNDTHTGRFEYRLRSIE